MNQNELKIHVKELASNNKFSFQWEYLCAEPDSLASFFKRYVILPFRLANTWTILFRTENKIEFCATQIIIAHASINVTVCIVALVKKTRLGVDMCWINWIFVQQYRTFWCFLLLVFLTSNLTSNLNLFVYNLTNTMEKSEFFIFPLRTETEMTVNQNGMTALQCVTRTCMRVCVNVHLTFNMYTKCVQSEPSGAHYYRLHVNLTHRRVFFFWRMLINIQCLFQCYHIK